MLARSFLYSSIAILTLSFSSCGDKKEDSTEKKSDKIEKKSEKPSDDKKPEEMKSGEMKPEAKDVKPTELKDAPKVSWEGYKKGTLKFPDIAGSKVNFHISGISTKGPLNISISTRKLPVGTIFQIGKNEFKVEKSSFQMFYYDIKDVISKIELDSVYNKYSYKMKPWDFNVTMKVTLPGHKPVDLKIPAIDPSSGINKYFNEIVDGKIEFQNEGKDAAKKDSMITVFKFSAPVVTGKGKLLEDVDVIAVVADEDSKVVKKCKFTKETVNVTMKDAKITVYERRTGKKLGEEVVKNSGKCPMFVSYDKKKMEGSKSVDRKDIEKWATKSTAKYLK